MLQSSFSRRQVLSTLGFGATTFFLVPRFALGQVKPSRISFTFDDTWHDSVWRGAIAMLDDAGFVATHYVITNWVGHTGQREFLEVGDLHKLIAKGHEIGAHTRSHAHLAQISNPATLNSEVSGSIDDLEAMLGTRSLTFSYPFGEWNEAVVTLLKQEGIVVARGTQTDLIASTTYKYNLRSHSIYDSTTHASVTAWIDKAKNEGKWYCMNFHRFDKPGGLTTARFKQIVDYVKQSQVQVATVRQCAATYFGV